MITSQHSRSRDYKWHLSGSGERQLVGMLVPVTILQMLLYNQTYCTKTTCVCLPPMLLYRIRGNHAMTGSQCPTLLRTAFRGLQMAQSEIRAVPGLLGSWLTELKSG